MLGSDDTLSWVDSDRMVIVVIGHICDRSFEIGGKILRSLLLRPAFGEDGDSASLELPVL